MLEEYEQKDNRIKIYFQPQNLGYTKNFEFVLTKSTADYIAFSDHDDIWYPNKIEESLKILKEKNADLKRQLTEQKKKNEALGKKLRTVEQENQKIRASWSFRIGKVLVWLPGKIKRLFRKQ